MHDPNHGDDHQDYPGADRGDDHEDDRRWLSYQQLGEARRISRASAIRLARKHRWRRQANNQGTVLVAVPVAFLTPDPRTSGDRHGDYPSNRPDDHPGGEAIAGAFDRALQAVQAAHAGEIAALRQRADTLRDRVEDLQVQVVQLEEEGAWLSAQAEAAEARANLAERELAGERIRAHTMSSHVEGYRADLAQARRELAAAQIAQSEAEAATEVRKARGLLARLRAAWQGGE